jgi:hypothetical protein
MHSNTTDSLTTTGSQEHREHEQQQDRDPSRAGEGLIRAHHPALPDRSWLAIVPYAIEPSGDHHFSVSIVRFRTM